MRVENRVLPAGPTVVDVLANGAFYYGLLRTLCQQERPVWSQMSFQAAEDNFDAGARHGIHAPIYWPGAGEVPATELLLRHLLPLAHQGLAAWGIDSSVRDRLLGVIEGRCTTQVNGAEWQARAFHHIDDETQPLDRRDALREMLRRYVKHMHSNEPVHTWPLTGTIIRRADRWSCVYAPSISAMVRGRHATARGITSVEVTTDRART